MWTPQFKVQCMLWLADLKSVTSVKRRARREWNVDPPTRKSIYEWDKTLREMGSLISQAGKHPKQHVTEETVDRVRESFSRSPHKSIRQGSRELGSLIRQFTTLFTNVSVCVLTNFNLCITLSQMITAKELTLLLKC